MKTGIIVAMDKELRLLLPMLTDHATLTLNNFEFHTGRLAGHEVVAVKCGIGKVNAAIGTLTLIENFHPDLVVNSGVAGGTGAGMPRAEILDVILADRSSRVMPGVYAARSKASCCASPLRPASPASAARTTPKTTRRPPSN